jgi:hypothetical protein
MVLAGGNDRGGLGGKLGVDRQFRLPLNKISAGGTRRVIARISGFIFFGFASDIKI